VQPCGLVRGEEERGVIGGCGVLKGRGLMFITREELVGAFTPASFRFQRERREETVEMMMLTSGSHLSARGERGGVYRFGFVLGGLRACFSTGPNGFPGALLYFYFSFASFLFLFSLFFHTLFKFESNQSKPTLQSFNNSKQSYRTAINKFS
jgi:hypothetical protein